MATDRRRFVSSGCVLVPVATLDRTGNGPRLWICSLRSLAVVVKARATAGWETEGCADAGTEEDSVASLCPLAAALHTLPLLQVL